MICSVFSRGTNHYNQVDILFVMPRFVVSSEKFRSPLDPAVAHSLNMELIHAFLRRHLLLGETTPTYTHHLRIGAL